MADAVEKRSQDRREALRNYFLAVTRDLVARGVVRRQRGQSIDDVLKVELRVVLKEVHSDLIAIGTEMGEGLVQGLISAGMRWLNGGR